LSFAPESSVSAVAAVSSEPVSDDVPLSDPELEPEELSPPDWAPEPPELPEPLPQAAASRTNAVNKQMILFVAI